MSKDKTNVWFRMGVTGKFTAGEIARMCRGDFKPVMDCFRREEMMFDGDCYSPDIDSDDSCIDVNFSMIEEPIYSARNNSIPDSHEVVEVCPHCDAEVVMNWDVKQYGFKAFCPHCGKRLMLCDECMHRTGECIDDCDYCSTTDTCRFNKGDEDENQADD